MSSGTAGGRRPSRRSSSRFPSRAGWSGDDANGGNWRIERDVLPLDPTVVTVCYGMNDGWYMEYTEDAGNYYRAGMNEDWIEDVPLRKGKNFLLARIDNGA